MTFLMKIKFNKVENYVKKIKGVCKIYEEHLKRLNPSSPQITYDISQVRNDFYSKLLSESLGYSLTLMLSVRLREFPLVLNY